MATIQRVRTSFESHAHGPFFMAFVLGYQHDVFVSYAQVDDQCFHGLEKGWVTTLIDVVKVRLAQKIGRRELFSLWMDHELAPNEPITSTILQHANASATLLVVLSPAYLASEWCRRERESFLSVIGERTSGDSRVFIVELADLGIRKPKEFADLIGYRFWDDDGTGRGRIRGYPSPDPRSPEDRPYYDMVDELCGGLAAELERLRERADEETKKEHEPQAQHQPRAAVASQAPSHELLATQPEETPLTIQHQPAVYLADVTDDLLARRSEIEAYLRQADFLVLPDTWYPRDPAAFADAVDQDLAKADVFVQLLSEHREERIPGYPNGRGGVQYARAAALDIPILQWRRRDLDLAAVDDGDYVRLLSGSTVLAVGMEEFKRTIVEKLNRFGSARHLQHDVTRELAFVNVTTDDWDVGQQLADMLARSGIDVSLPMTDGEPREIRKQLEHNLRHCDGLLIVFGRSPANWVREQLRQLRRIMNLRQASLKATAILQAPPPEKERLDVYLPNVPMIDCRTGMEEYKIQEFVSALREANR